MVNISLLKLSEPLQVGGKHTRHALFSLLCMCFVAISSLSGLTMALIDACYDKQKTVRDAMCSALYDLGVKQPILVMSSCSSYLAKHAKVSVNVWSHFSTHVHGVTLTLISVLMHACLPWPSRYQKFQLCILFNVKPSENFDTRLSFSLHTS